jgi:hypothetical protein
MDGIAQKHFLESMDHPRNENLDRTDQDQKDRLVTSGKT